MAPRYHEVSFATFHNDLLPGQNISEAQLPNLLTIEDDPDGDYFAFVRKINQIAQLDSTKFVFKDLIAWYEAAGLGRGYHPAIALYPTVDWIERKYAVASDRQKEAAIYESSRELIANYCYEWMTAAFDVRHGDDECAGFGMKPGEPLLPDTVGAHEARARFEYLASQLMYCQHRTHAFMFYLDGKYARVFRWDRNGALVSPPISFDENLGDLWNIIYRLVRADKTVQGFDTTVSRASYFELLKLQEMGWNPDEPLDEYRNMFWQHYCGSPLYKVECDEVLESGSRRTRSMGKKTLLICKPIVGSHDVTGNGTKAWVAYCTEDKTMVLLKEQWRDCSPGTHAEVETYQRLHQHGVRNIATAVAGGDVAGPDGLYKTLSQQFFDQDDLNVPQRVKTRLVLKEFGRALETYEGSKELISVTTQALIAHKDAWEKAGVLHGDVSPRNILIDATSTKGSPQGLLIDWEMCRYKEDLEVHPAPSNNGFTGTWAFSSALSLKYPRKPRELADDLEAFVYIPTYYAFRNHNHSRTIRRDLREYPYGSDGSSEPLAKTNWRDYDHISLAAMMFQFFHLEHKHENGLSSGGDMKFDRIRWGRPPVNLNYPQDAPLNSLIKRGFGVLQQHYKGIDYDALEQYLAEPPEPGLAAQPEPAARPEQLANELARDAPTHNQKPEQQRPLEDEEMVATQPALGYSLNVPEGNSSQDAGLANPAKQEPVEFDHILEPEPTSVRPLHSHAALFEIFDTVLPRPKLKIKIKLSKADNLVKMEGANAPPLPRLRPRKSSELAKMPKSKLEVAVIVPMRRPRARKVQDPVRRTEDTAVAALSRLRPRVNGPTKRKSEEADVPPLPRPRPRKRQKQQ